MHNEAPLLTISIPTFNRSRILSGLLDSLTPQLKDEPRVELLISDNASSDDTQAVLDEHRRRGLIFQSICNETNLGPDRNSLQCFERASGKFVWVFGDDDIMVPDAIATILAIIGENDYDILHLRVRDIENGAELPALARPARTEIIADPLTFTLRTHVSLTFITGNIVNKHRVLALPHEPFSDLLETNFVQLGWMYTLLRNFRSGVYIHDILIASGTAGRGGYELYRVFGTNLKRITETWLVKPALVRVVLNGTVQRFFPPFVLRSKIGAGPFSGESPDALLWSLFSDNFRYYFFLYPLLKLPGALGRIWFFLCRILNRFDKAMGHPMLR